MKYNIIIALSLVLFGACSKTNVTSNTKNSNSATTAISGNWNYVRDTVSIYKNGTANTQYYTYPSGVYINFATSNSGNDNNTSFTYKLTGNTMTVYYAAYTQAGVSYPPDTGVSTFVILNGGKNLSLHYDYTYKDANGLEQGNSEFEYLSK